MINYVVSWKTYDFVTMREKGVRRILYDVQWREFVVKGIDEEGRMLTIPHTSIYEAHEINTTEN